MAQHTPKKTFFFMGTHFEDYGLHVGRYSHLSHDEQQAILQAIKSTPAWQKFDESKQICVALRSLFRACYSHKDSWDGLNSTPYWTEVRDGTCWTRSALDVRTVRKLVVLLFAARMNRVRQIRTMRPPKNGLVSRRIQRYYNEMIDHFHDVEQFKQWVFSMVDAADIGVVLDEPDFFEKFFYVFAGDESSDELGDDG